jgi:hypothetical protein
MTAAKENAVAYARRLYEKGHINAAEFEELCSSEEFARQMAAIDYVREQDADVLRELAKR